MTYGTHLASMTSVDSVKAVVQKLLSENIVDSVLVASGTPYSKLPMPTLFSDPAKMDRVAPLAPASPLNASRVAAKIIARPTDKKIALVLRPCEIRALVELAKLNQCTFDNAVVIGIECPGRMENDVFLKRVEEIGDITDVFLSDGSFKNEITGTCSSCDKFLPETADIAICAVGTKPIGFLAQTETGRKIFEKLDLTPSEPPEERASAIESLKEEREAKKTILFDKTGKTLKKMERFQTEIANCINCYNCRMVCPVCYCKECVFMTDVFNHKPETLLLRAEKKGAVKMPTDTSMFHMTRLSHIGHSCIGCGQCSSVCPMGIRVADIFRTVAAKTQEFYGYEPGRDLLEQIPQLVFKE